MKTHFLLFLFFPLAALFADPVALGDKTSPKTWVYLCGVTPDFNSPDEVRGRELLNTIGQNLGIKILAIQPIDHSPMYGNMLYWPQNTKEEVSRTFRYIQDNTRHENVSGYIGFSSGGYFLLKLAEKQTLGVPIIAIGAGGNLGKVEAKNRVFLLIGKLDTAHYQSAKQFYRQTQGTALNATLIEYDQGHYLPEDLLQKTIQRSLSNRS